MNSDHLTALGLVALLAAGLCYWYSRWNSAALLLVIVCLAANWAGDSLDGTLARVRDKQRPRYGFYVDHIVDGGPLRSEPARSSQAARKVITNISDIR